MGGEFAKAPSRSSASADDLISYINLIISGLNKLAVAATKKVYRGTNLRLAISPGNCG